MDLSELLRNEGIAPDAIARAVRHAERDRIPLAKIVVEHDLMSDDALADLVAREFGTAVVDVDLGEVDRESVKLFTPADTRRHLFIPIAPDPSNQVLRVAFANPLDPDALAFARDTSGLSVQPLVATVAGVLSAIDRAYQDHDTRVVNRPLASESTQQIRHRDPQTSPLHRLDDEVSAEQRHEALLLALIEAGVITRQDYLEAVKRLLRRR